MIRYVPVGNLVSIVPMPGEIGLFASRNERFLAWEGRAPPK